MTVSIQTTKNIFQGDGVQTVFPFSFPITKAADMKLFFVKADNTIEEILNNFTVDINNSTVTYPNSGTPVQGDEELVLIRATAATQELDLDTNDDFDALQFETALDKLTLLVLQMQEQLDRTFKIPINETIETGDITEFIALINASFPTFSSGTYAELKALSVAFPTLRRWGWATDLLVFQVYIADMSVGDEGWLLLGGGE